MLGRNSVVGVLAGEREELVIENVRISQERQGLAREREQIVGRVQEFCRWRLSEPPRRIGWHDRRREIRQPVPIDADLDRWLERLISAISRRERVLEERERVVAQRARLGAARGWLAMEAKRCADVQLALIATANKGRET